jgi:hypothetical protein
MVMPGAAIGGDRRGDGIAHVSVPFRSDNIH